MRIFPGKKDMNDIYPATRRKVDLVATVEPLIAGVPVYFRVFDVDDPFDQLRACDPNNPAPDCVPNVGIIDNDLVGPDNRGSDSAPGYYSAVTLRATDEGARRSGQARVKVDVSMYPGNNYRAAAAAAGSS